MENDKYIIQGGEAGKSRLKTLSEALAPYTRSLLEAQGVQEGNSFLDLGCGGGYVSMLAASMVGGHGRVTGIDFDKEIIRMNQEEALAAGVHNVEFKPGSAYEIDYSDIFDFAYARFLFSHLKSPIDVLKRWCRV